MKTKVLGSLAILFFILLIILCGGGVRGCSNDFDRSTGNPESFKWWAL